MNRTTSGPLKTYGEVKESKTNKISFFPILSCNFDMAMPMLERFAQSAWTVSGLSETDSPTVSLYASTKLNSFGSIFPNPFSLKDSQTLSGSYSVVT